MNEQYPPTWLSKISDPQKKAAYLKQLQLERMNEVLEEQRGRSGEDFLPPATPPASSYEAYLRAIMSPTERWRAERGWH